MSWVSCSGPFPAKFPSPWFGINPLLHTCGTYPHWGERDGLCCWVLTRARFCIAAGDLWWSVTVRRNRDGRSHCEGGVVVMVMVTWRLRWRRELEASRKVSQWSPHPWLCSPTANFSGSKVVFGSRDGDVPSGISHLRILFCLEIDRVRDIPLENILFRCCFLPSLGWDRI